jgi:hypothetical protein
MTFALLKAAQIAFPLSILGLAQDSADAGFAGPEALGGLYLGDAGVGELTHFAALGACDRGLGHCILLLP